MELLCSLCLTKVHEGKGKSRRKRLFGNSRDIQAERQLLEKLIKESGEPKGLKLFNQDATICYQCSSILGKIIKLEIDIRNAKSVIIESVCKLKGVISQKRSSTYAAPDLSLASKRVS